MKIIYDHKTDILTIFLAEGSVAESDENKPGIILDYNANGNLISLEVLDASKRVTAPGQIEYQTVPVAV